MIDTGPLISHVSLAGRLDAVALCDIRWSLTDPTHGRSNYEAGHIPGAVFVDLDEDLAAPPGLEGRHPLPSVGEFASTLGRLGIDPGSHVVVYDDMGGAIAARMWWMLRSIGHDSVQLLDGGFRAWVEAGHPVETGSSEPSRASYPVPERFHGVVGLEDLPGRSLVDARSPERYRGETEPVDPKAGHIPGAINVPTADNLDPEGCFLSKDQLRRRYQTVADDPVVYCGSGVTSCHNALAMVLAGFDMPDVYVGSFSEWSRRDMPVETGSSP